MPLASRLLQAALWLLGSLPLRALQRLAGVLAWLSRASNNRECRVARVNVGIAFAQRDAAARDAMHRECLRQTAATALECARLWSRPPRVALGWIRAVEGGELLDAARAGGRGVIVAAPHLGNWELLCHYLASTGPLSIVYRAPQWAPAEQLLLHGRGGAAVEQLLAQPSSVRRMLRALKEGRLLGILPDQQPKVGEGEFAPFFGRPALTMTLLSRLAARAGVEVVFGFAERLPDGAGFAIRFQPAPPGIADDDPVVAATALNAGVEACVRRAPQQYQWTYKRWSRAAPGLVNPYLGGHAAAVPPSESA
jgi:Kdo2-lipid IVA lauroyltransferase/acyltransferase